MKFLVPRLLGMAILADHQALLNFLEDYLPAETVSDHVGDVITLCGWVQVMEVESF